MTLEVTQQLSRFHLDTLDRMPDADIDIHDVTLAIVARGGGDGEARGGGGGGGGGSGGGGGPVTSVTSLLESARLVLRSGVRYGLVGPNGAGKSALLRAIASGALKGLPPRARVRLVSPSGADGAASAAAASADTCALAAAAAAEDAAGADARSVLDVVLESDPDRAEAAADTAALEAAIDRLDREQQQRSGSDDDGNNNHNNNNDSRRRQDCQPPPPPPPTPEHVAAARALVSLVERMGARAAAAEAKALRDVAEVRSRRRGREARHAANAADAGAAAQAGKASRAEAEAAEAAVAAAASAEPGSPNDNDDDDDDGGGGGAEEQGATTPPRAPPSTATTMPDLSALASARQRASELLAALYEREAEYEPELEAHRAGQVLSGLGVGPERQAKPLGSLSGGWRARVRLACALFASGAGASSGGRRGVDLLLLDEPTTHLDLPGIMWLRRWLCCGPGGSGGSGGGGGGGGGDASAARPPTVVVISHDVAFLNAVTDETIIISPQKRALTYFPGTYAAFVAARADAVRDAARSAAALERQRKHAEASIAAGERAARRGGDDKRLGMVASRRKKLDERFGLERGLRGGRFKVNRDYGGYFLSRRPPPPTDLLEEAARPPPSMRLPRGALPQPLRYRGPLLQLRAATYRYPDGGGGGGGGGGAAGEAPSPGGAPARPRPPPPAAALKDVTLAVPARARIVLLGRNGSGKSTLLGLLSGRLALPPGSVERHPSVRVAECGQHEADALAARAAAAAAAAGASSDGGGGGGAAGPPRTAAEYLASVAPDLVGGREQDARDACGGVGLGAVAAAAPLAALSGGQRARLALLATCCAHRPHVLLLDEPTNFLALEAVAALADLLRARSRDAAVVVATHDVDFADRLLRPGTGPLAAAARGAQQQQQQQQQQQGGGDGGGGGGGSDGDGEDGGAGGEDGPEVLCYVLRAGVLEPQHPPEGAAARYAGRVLARLEAREAAAGGRP
jgi:ATPase subunit of ABC transporter with duplicated ATPase domains